MNPLKERLAQYFTEELQNSKSFSGMQYFADTEQTYKNKVQLPFSPICKRDLGNLKFDHIYQFNQYPMQEFFNQFSFLKEEIERYKKWTTPLFCSLAIQWEVKHWRMF